MPAVVWRARALGDVQAIVGKISAGSRHGAEKLLRTIAAQAALLAIHPHIGRAGREAGTRELVVHRHYTMIYKVVGDRVYILRILHTARQWPKPGPGR